MMGTKLRKVNLFALYVTENSVDFYFVKYFCENEHAFYFGEFAYELLNRDIKGYIIQEHLISTNKAFSELLELENAIDNHSFFKKKLLC